MTESICGVNVHYITRRKDIKLPLTLNMYINRLLQDGCTINEIIVESAKEECNLRIKNKILLYANKNMVAFYYKSHGEVVITIF